MNSFLSTIRKPQDDSSSLKIQTDFIPYDEHSEGYIETKDALRLTKEKLQIEKLERKKDLDEFEAD